MKRNIFLSESQIKVIKEWGRKKTEPITYSMDDKIELVDDPILFTISFDCKISTVFNIWVIN